MQIGDTMKRYIPKYEISRTDRGEIEVGEFRKLLSGIQPTPSRWWWVVSILIGVLLGLSFLMK